MVKFRELYLDMSMIKDIESHVYGIICVLIIWPRFLINDNSTVMKGRSPWPQESQVSHENRWESKHLIVWCYLGSTYRVLWMHIEGALILAMVGQEASQRIAYPCKVNPAGMREKKSEKKSAETVPLEFHALTFGRLSSRNGKMLLPLTHPIIQSD